MRTVPVEPEVYCRKARASGGRRRPLQSSPSPSAVSSASQAISAEATAASFGARLAPGNEGPYLRTGDLGFLRDGRLFVVGRLKNLIIIRGRNHHPEDIEATAARANPLLAKSGGVALGVEEGRRAVVAIIHELTRGGWRHADPAGVGADIREAIAAEHGLQVSRVRLIRPGSLPRTTSGKVRRAACSALLESGGFETLPAEAPR